MRDAVVGDIVIGNLITDGDMASRVSRRIGCVTRLCGCGCRGGSTDFNGFGYTLKEEEMTILLEVVE